ncbi:MAG: hypothetical protein A3F47_01295 [Candidatus Staskawiczbacteria bacterium RIFCSPHIGHO2_12_FULL_38_11]|uniref:Putative pterin-4-alpha-carbinolamine dehydratase n=1 Tax=Candidatus Staskawiczbacteria bacterium RIFCSPHIGHO2_12_FULL_38_11 TaxID=1802209 RepID=A0A1G2I7F6_9BACT|nr:MAG: hypothetical protein A3F47_01295 [Candidatus Staskawiczbacteria bacterium RIFCSPHIGHO2_12_FULL_38_11]
MENLVDKKILSHEEMEKLGEEEIKDYLSQLKNWEFLETQKIIKEFKFDDFVKAMEFVNKIADVAEKEGHHPDMAIHYNKVEITLWTHFINGLSENDFIIAAKIDAI